MDLLNAIYHTKKLPKGFIAGIEYEIEAIDLVYHEKLDLYGIVHVEDHSLRNNGREFKTEPLSFDLALDSFLRVQDCIKVDPKLDPYSERTSIHVHVNVGNLSEKQAKDFILMYALLEPLFFKFAGPARQESIYCVPLSYTYLPNEYHQPFTRLVERWHKYTAFNIVPAASFGTFEFRHLGGTNDYNRFEQWLTSIKNLYDFISEREFDMLSFIKRQENLTTLAKQVVPILAAPYSQEEIDEMLYDSVLDVKLACGGIK